MLGNSANNHRYLAQFGNRSLQNGTNTQPNFDNSANSNWPLNSSTQLAPVSESAFTHQQFQLLKSQMQAIKYLTKSPGQGPMPQNLISFVTNPASSYPTDPYLPAPTRNDNAINPSFPQSTATMPNIPANSTDTKLNAELVEKKKGKRGPKPRNKDQPKKMTKKQIREEEQRLAAEKRREDLEQQIRVKQEQSHLMLQDQPSLVQPKLEPQSQLQSQSQLQPLSQLHNSFNPLPNKAISSLPILLLLCYWTRLLMRKTKIPKLLFQ